jgi:hypothetical protein
MHIKWRREWKGGFQNDEILTQLKATNGHATYNIILKRW